MDITSVLLGVLQGATEFLPVSSSGHLVLAEAFFNVEEAGLTFDVALHMGTLLAIVVYFRDDWLAMGNSCLKFGSKEPEDVVQRRTFYQICIATLPAVVAGLLLGDLAETTFRNPALVASTLAGVGAILLWADLSGSRTRDFSELTYKDAVIIGLAQACAIVPGVSRSGITMTAGLFRGLDRTAVARFSFLMSAPIIAGAGVLNLFKILSNGIEPGQGSFFFTGFVASTISGYFFISFLMKYVQTRSLAVFAYYRFALAAVVVWSLVI